MVSNARGQPVRNALMRTELRPVELAPSAILIVRRLQDSLPGALVSRTEPARMHSRWERATRTALSAKLAAACRPVRGVIPVTAEAVLFADRAELLACLAMDLARGATSGKWWWIALLRGMPELGAHALTLLLSREAHRLPAVLTLLERWDEAEHVVRVLTPAHAHQLVSAVAQAYGLPSAFVDALSPHRRVGLTRAPRQSRSEADVATVAEGVDVRPAPPQRAHAGPTQAAGQKPLSWLALLLRDVRMRDQPIEQRALVGLCLVLQHAPLHAGNARVAAEFVEWVQTECDAARATDQVAARQVGRGLAVGHATSGALSNETSREISQRRRLDSTRPSIAPSAATERRARAGRGDDVRSIQSDQAAARRALPRDQRLMRVDSESTVGHTGLEARTDLGGVLFLINALRALDFWRSLLDSEMTRFELGGWAWLEIVARQLLERRIHTFEADPLWTLLAELDGRDARAGLQLNAAEWEIVRTVGDRVRKRLDESLDTGGDDVVDAVLIRRGLVQITATHVDLIMTLDQITVPVRLAGLDANPGWVPELGRVITFHFE